MFLIWQLDLNMEFWNIVCQYVQFIHRNKSMNPKHYEFLIFSISKLRYTVSIILFPKYSLEGAFSTDFRFFFFGCSSELWVLSTTCSGAHAANSQPNSCASGTHVWEWSRCCSILSASNDIHILTDDILKHKLEFFMKINPGVITTVHVYMNYI